MTKEKTWEVSDKWLWITCTCRGRCQTSYWEVSPIGVGGIRQALGRYQTNAACWKAVMARLTEDFYNLGTSFKH
jgi:hypothetical protein